MGKSPFEQRMERELEEAHRGAVQRARKYQREEEDPASNARTSECCGARLLYSGQKILCVNCGEDQA